ncbi:SDR family oxidoreductase [Brevibacterium sp.]|uniref:SDR family oxidoreductase n=1 Tax=Brevibacterium sp. TaxID=1701 RepID=UPI0025BB4400|nr:SDR family oxidoreductase [Brevibacterium sp.]
MSARFTGKVAIVTGASRGIGLGIAQRLVDEGARVVITARGEEALAAAVEQLGGPEKALAVAGKADDPAHQDETIAKALDTFGSVDVLVNNTGINPVYGPLIELDDAAIQKIFTVNVHSTMQWTRKVYEAAMKENGGSIVNLSSVAAVRQPHMIGFYGATKSMITHITKQYAMELGPDIRVNAIAPAVVKTRFAEKLYEAGEEKVAAAYPLKRLGEPEDIAALAAFLLSDEASWITGELVVADGGVTLGGGA